jgi:branched-chain amino acid transport system substrate-binding protein
VNGDGGPVLAAVFEDDHDQEAAAVEAVRRLIVDRKVVAVVGELFSPFVMASRPLVEQTKVAYLTGGTSPRTTDGSRWIFRVGATDALLAQLVARHIVVTLGFKNLAVLHSRVGIHNARAELLIKVLADKYLVVPSLHATWRGDDRDFKQQLGAVEAAGAQAIIALGETGEAASFLKQARDLGIHAPIIAHRDFGARSALRDAGAAAEGVRIFTEYLPVEPDRQEWARAYEARYGAEANVIAAQYFDAVLLLARAAQDGGPTREGIAAGLEHLQGFHGVMADYTFKGGNGVHRFLVARVRNGRPTLETVLDEDGR